MTSEEKKNFSKIILRAQSSWHGLRLGSKIIFQSRGVELKMTAHVGKKERGKRERERERKRAKAPLSVKINGQVLFYPEAEGSHRNNSVSHGYPTRSLIINKPSVSHTGMKLASVFTNTIRNRSSARVLVRRMFFAEEERWIELRSEIATLIRQKLISRQV